MALIEHLDAHGTLHDPEPPPIPPEILQSQENLARVLVIDGTSLPALYGLRHCAGTTYRPVKELNDKLAQHVECADDETFVWGHADYSASHMQIRQIMVGDDVSIFMDHIGCKPGLVAWKVPKADDYVMVHFRVDGYGTYTRVPSIIVPKHLMTDPIGDHLPDAAHEYLREALRPYCKHPAARDVLRDHILVHINTNFLQQYIVFLDDDEVALAQSGFKNYTAIEVHDSATLQKLIDVWRPLTAKFAYGQETSRRSIDSFRLFCRESSTLTWYTARLGEHHDSVDLRLFGFPKRHVYYPWVNNIENLSRFRLSNFIASKTPKHHGYSDEGALVLGALTTIREEQEEHENSAQPDPTSLLDWLHPHQRDSVRRMLHMEDREHGFFGTICTPVPSGVDNTLLWYTVRGGVMIPGCEWDTQTSGGFLSDEPGMGKTRSVIATCLLRPSMDPERRATLICVQPSVLGHWAEEIQRVAGAMKVYVYHGTKAKGLVADAPHRMASDYDIVLTTYATYTGSHDIIGDIVWHRVVFDESHVMSDRVAYRAPLGRYRWCVSATPMTNLHRQLRALKISHTNLHSTIRHEISSMYYVLQPNLIRHSLSCLNLPPVIQHLHHVNLRPPERVIYDRVLATMHANHHQYRTTAYYMRYFNALRNVCLTGEHTLQERGETIDRTPDTSLVAPDDDVCPVCMNMFEHPAVTPCGHWFCAECIALALARAQKCPMCRGVTMPAMMRYGVVAADGLMGYDMTDDDERHPLSSKITAFVDTVSAILRGSRTAKVLVCAHSMTALRLLKDALCASESVAATKVRMIHGGVLVPQRAAAIRAFQRDEDTRVMMVTYRSAAAGITLTAANHVCIISPHPSADMETQLVGRAHRFGQTSAVHVHRFFAKNTVEEVLVHEKRTLAKLFGH